MKTLIIINGAPGVGKSSVSKKLASMLPNSAFFDADWSWYMHKRIKNDETVSAFFNICSCVINNHLSISHLDYVIFCWLSDKVKHWQRLKPMLDLENVNVCKFNIFCSTEELESRIKRDKVKKPRTLEASSLLQENCLTMKNYKAINSTGKSINQTATEIINQVKRANKKN